MILGVRELGMSLREPAMRLEISAPAVGDSVERGEDTACPFHSLGKSILSALHSIHLGEKTSIPIFNWPKGVG